MTSELPARLEEIRARVEKTICPTFSSDGVERTEGRISREDFDTLILAALSAPPAPVTEAMVRDVFHQFCVHDWNRPHYWGTADTERFVTRLFDRLTAALGTAGEPEADIDYEVMCDGEFAASSTDLADAKHYAAVYSQDGPVEIIEVRRRPLTAAPSPDAEGE